MYLVVADVSLGRTLPYEFLKRVRDDFTKKHGDTVGEKPVPHQLDKQYECGHHERFALRAPAETHNHHGRHDCRDQLKKHMEYVVDNQSEFNKVALVQNKANTSIWSLAASTRLSLSQAKLMRKWFRRLGM